MLYLELDKNILEYLNLHYLLWLEDNTHDHNLMGVLRHYDIIVSNYTNQKITDEEYIHQSMNFYGKLYKTGLSLMFLSGEDKTALQDNLINFYESLVNIHSKYQLLAKTKKSSGWTLYVMKTYDKALNLFLQSAKNGDKQVYPILGAMYHDGEGTLVSYRKSRYWWCKAALLGDKNARKLLGSLHQHGRIDGVNRPLFVLYSLLETHFCDITATQYLQMNNYFLESEVEDEF